MTYSRPGAGTHLVNTTGGTLQHGQPVVIAGIVGIAVKQKATAWSAGLAPANQIPANEKFWCINKGIVQVDSTPLSSPAKGDPVFITAGNALTKTASGNTKFGRIVELPGDGRSVPTGKARIDLDLKDSF